MCVSGCIEWQYKNYPEAKCKYAKHVMGPLNIIRHC